MSQTYTAFFYGTLLHPAILRRVIGHEGQKLEICPALLLDYTRHRIKRADYPAVLPYSRSRELYEHDLAPEERVVRGTLVKGLEEADIGLLDTFEGDEYTRENVSAYPIGSFIPLSSPESSAAAPLGTPPPLPPLDTLNAPIPAQTYIWAQSLLDLSPTIWEYADFVRDSAHKWVGAAAEANADYVEVDRRRAMNGNIAGVEVTSIVAEKD
ncbi:uncharacterized protein B0H18DRAFT_995151 [Fomitopsis serialis]|uniref:uncharacterized protein n=1 Tax=Fomitopsis serialis TaxID=139415 RepID=UPI002007F95A|nr:uncharacterized protein B0H18DRAFT_995151 [Neoantrodia serialis]KAH9930083.1 hypothetical protein B0H18DRAFT_995151 [Neoantrodia serialis]